LENIRANLNLNYVTPNLRFYPDELQLGWNRQIGRPENRDKQEAPFVVAFSNIDYLRFGNVKLNDKSLTLCD